MGATHQRRDTSFSCVEKLAAKCSLAVFCSLRMYIKKILMLEVYTEMSSIFSDYCVIVKVYYFMRHKETGGVLWVIGYK